MASAMKQSSRPQPGSMSAAICVKVDSLDLRLFGSWIPACAGMTPLRDRPAKAAP
jgi:hypothetical protein